MGEPRRNTRSIWARRGIVLGLVILYILTFPAMYAMAGKVALVPSVIIVIATGWYFGMYSGILAGLLVLGGNYVLYYAVQNETESPYTLLPILIILIAIGVIAGRLQGLAREREINARGLRERERFQSLSNMILMNILDPPNAEAVYDLLVLQLTNLFVADYGFVVRWDETTKQACCLTTTLPSNNFSDAALDSPHLDFTLSVLEKGSPVMVEDVQKSNQAVIPLVLKNLSLPIHSALVIPLSVKEYRFGTATVTFGKPTHFSQEELDRIALAGNHIALALRTIQQEAIIQGRLNEAKTLADIGRALSETERVGLDHVLQLIVDSTRALIPGTEQAVIHLLDKEEQSLIPQAVSSREAPTKVKLNMRRGEGVAGQVLAQGEVVNIPDVETDPRFLRQRTPARFRSLMVAPVQSGEERLGTISIQSIQRNAFSAGQGALLTSLGTQAAIAIENVRLLEATQQGLKEVNALYRITQGLAASLETEQLMNDVVKLLQENLGYYHAQIYTIDPQNDELVLTQASGEIGEQLKRMNQRMPAGAGIVGHAVETGEPFVTNNVEEVIFFVRNPLLPNTQAELAVPIKVEGRVLGVLDVQQTPPGHLTERDLQLVSAVADQLSVALQKASLYSDLQTSLIQEKNIRLQLVQSERLALVGRLLASVSHELNNPLQAIQNALFLLKEEHGLSVQGRQDLQIVLSEAERMAAMIDRLRTSYRPTRKEDFHAIQLNTIIEDVYNLVATHLRHNRIAFEFHPNPGLPAVSGSADQIRQVVLNLLMNAAEAMPGGGDLSVSTDLTDSNEVQASFLDTGTGVDPEILPHVFDAFITNKEGGTGLGLTITYDIIHRHNGRISAENVPGKGALFTFWLPAQGKESP